jgi:TPR repeat protein
MESKHPNMDIIQYTLGYNHSSFMGLTCKQSEADALIWYDLSLEKDHESALMYLDTQTTKVKI